MQKIQLHFAVLLFTIIAFSCSDNESEACFDKQLHEEHKDDICMQDCPGVRGCDGKTYCNECIANSQGIRVEN